METVRRQLTFLFLGGAKRVRMAELFEQAAGRMFNADMRIIGYELDRVCPLGAGHQIVEGRRWGDPSVFDHLEEVVEEYEVDALIPFVDGAVGVAAEFAARHRGRPVFVPASDRRLSDTMFDKVEAAALFERLGLPVPATYRDGDPCLRLIAKPRFGSASKGIVEINSLQKLYEMQSMGGRYLIQERIDNREELTVDCYVGVRTGRIEGVSPRLRLEVSGGEVVRTLTVDNPEAVALVRRTLQATGLRGAVTVQLIRDLDTGRYMIMEINPRLGGGAVASVYAGFNLPAAIIADCLGRDIAAGEPRPGYLTARYLADVVFVPEND